MHVVMTTEGSRGDGGVTTANSTAAIIGGAVGGVVCILVLAIVVVLAVLIFTRIRKTKTYGIRGECMGMWDFMHAMCVNTICHCLF